MRNRLTTTILLILCIPFTGGCSDPYSMISYDGMELAQVNGCVTLDGEPLAKAQVIFESTDKTYAYGLTDSDGNYTLQFNSTKKGVTPGHKTVRITTSLCGLEFALMDETFVPSDEKIPVQYNRDSELTAEIIANQSQNCDFDLTSDGKKVKAMSLDAEGE